ncbi:MAG: hypothetical protein KA155_08085 [Alphaproteobacteria bacterium]|nr:hypothetical protein [Alphaproteobacteria bacterium]
MSLVIGAKDKDGFEKGKPSEKKGRSGMSRPRPGMSDFLAGEAKDFVSELYPYLPFELIGGSVPHIPGTEEEAVWNAAAQACSTEKVHFCYSVDSGKVWYLACPSMALASNPHSWCPLAAALPGNSEYWDHETVYLYEQEGIASALRWDPETGRMQVFLGASRTILPRVQSMDANFVTINPEVADIVPWRNKQLKTEKLSRATARMLLFSGMLVAFIAALVLVFNLIGAGLTQRDLTTVQQETEAASNELMLKAHSAMQSDTIKHIVRIQELLDALAAKDGTLVRYEVKGGKVEWEALVPKAFAAEFGQPTKIDEKDGRIRIKNSK